MSSNPAVIGYPPHTPPSPLSAPPPPPPSSSSRTSSDNAISIKVMRLRRPEFNIQMPVLCEDSDMLGETQSRLLSSLDKKTAAVKLASSASSDAASADSLPAAHPATLPLSENLLLPSSFGNVYVGETLSIYISLHNQSGVELRRVSVKAELQTATQRITILDTSAPSQPASAPAGPQPPAPPPQQQPSTLTGFSFASNSNRDFVFEQPLNEQGLNVLVITVSFQEPDSLEWKQIRRFNKFPVNHPLSMKTKVHALKDQIFVTSELQNLMPIPVFMESVRMDPSLGFVVIDHNGHMNGDEPLHALDAPGTCVNLMEPAEVRRYVYQFVKKTADVVPPRMPGQPAPQSISSLGKIDIRWRTSGGEPGRLVTSTVQYKSAPKPDVEMIVLSIPNELNVEEPFTVKCAVQNNFDRMLSLSLFLNQDKMYPIVPCGSTRIKLKELRPQEKTEVELTLISLRPGIQNIGGFELRESPSDLLFHVPLLATVLIQ